MGGFQPFAPGWSGQRRSFPAMILFNNVVEVFHLAYSDQDTSAAIDLLDGSLVVPAFRH
jgi:hypothetical protein